MGAPEQSYTLSAPHDWVITTSSGTSADTDADEGHTLGDGVGDSNADEGEALGVGDAEGVMEGEAPTERDAEPDDVVVGVGVQDVTLWTTADTFARPKPPPSSVLA